MPRVIHEGCAETTQSGPVCADRAQRAGLGEMEGGVGEMEGGFAGDGGRVCGRWRAHLRKSRPSTYTREGATSSSRATNSSVLRSRWRRFIAKPPSTSAPRPPIAAVIL